MNEHVVLCLKSIEVAAIVIPEYEKSVKFNLRTSHAAATPFQNLRDGRSNPVDSLIIALISGPIYFSVL